MITEVRKNIFKSFQNFVNMKLNTVIRCQDWEMVRFLNLV